MSDSDIVLGLYRTMKAAHDDYAAEREHKRLAIEERSVEIAETVYWPMLLKKCEAAGRRGIGACAIDIQADHVGCARLNRYELRQAITLNVFRLAQQHGFAAFYSMYGTVKVNWRKPLTTDECAGAHQEPPAPLTPQPIYEEIDLAWSQRMASDARGENLEL